MADVFTGLTITMASGFFAEILSIDWSGYGERQALQSSHAGTTTWHTFVPSLLQDPGTVSVGMQFVAGTTIPSGSAAETVTVTFTDTGTATHAASGFMTNFGITGELEQIVEATADIKLSGAITLTP